MSQIRIHTERVRETGHHLSSRADWIEQVGAELGRAIGSLDLSMWNGHSRAQAEPLLEQVRPASAQLAHELERLGQLLRRVAESFEQEDATAAHNLEEMPWVDFAAGGGGAVLGAATAAMAAGGILTDASSPIPDFSQMSWAQRFKALDEIKAQITRLEQEIQHIAELLKQEEAGIANLDAEIQTLKAQREALQKEAEDWKNRILPAEGGLQWGFDDKFPDAPWRTRADEYEDQLKALDEKIANLEQQKQQLEAFHTQHLQMQTTMHEELQNARLAQEQANQALAPLGQYDGHSAAKEVVKKPWVTVNAPVTNAPGERDPRVYDAVLNQFAVGDNSRYAAGQQGKGETYCNIYVSDATRAMGAEIPHRVDAQGNPVATGGSELDANATIQWIEQHGTQQGWRAVSPEEAQRMANQGQPVVATFKNPGGIGHVAMVRPGEYSPQTGPTIAQAGAKNFNEGSATTGFGRHPIVYYVHD